MEPDRDISDRVREISEHAGHSGPEPIPDDSGLPTRQSCPNNQSQRACYQGKIAGHPGRYVDNITH